MDFLQPPDADSLLAEWRGVEYSLHVDEAALLHDLFHQRGRGQPGERLVRHREDGGVGRRQVRSEEHTSELQSPCNLVCRLLLEKKKKLRERVRTPEYLVN